MKKLLVLLLLAATPLFANPFLVCPTVTSGLSNSPVTYTVSGLPNSPIVINAATITTGTVQLDLDLGAGGQAVPYGTYTVSATATNPNGTSAASANLTLNVPLVSVSAATSVTATTATLNGGLTQDGGTAATTEGFLWGATTAYGNTASSGGSWTSGAFTQNLTGLTANTTYHYQSFASNANCSNYSGDQTFTTSVSGPSVIQHWSNYSASSVSTLTCGFTTNQTAGNANIIFLSHPTAQNVSSVVDSKSNTYSKITSETTGSGFTTVEVWWCSSIASSTSTNTVTLTFSAGTTPSVIIQEINGLNGTVDISNIGNGSSGTSLSTSASSTTHANDWLFGAFVFSNVSVWSAPGTGYTLLQLGGNILATEYDTITATGSENATATLTTSSGWAGIMVAFEY